ncbi:trace amine-associated receptor 1-like [Clupea harengus]|uniref:Trace amine-associated receptor 1-like n=1 Tax=Clupea harengus TaxID=7950 RepID=A0A6P3VXL4_CLUHA|nr:trace amine-associated receptor 1-like [Clupea harengus]
MNISVPQGVQFCYEELNGSCTRITYPLSIRIPLYLFFTSTVIVIVGGNILVMITILNFEQLQTPTNYLVFSMSVADLLLGMVVMPPNMIESLEKCWYFGDFLCKFHASVDITLCNASVLHLTCISIDRFCAVTKPLQYQNKMTTCVVLTMISVSWIFSAIFGFAVIFSPSDSDPSAESVDVDCIGGCSGLHEKEIGVSYFFVFYFIPLTIMSTIYLKIFVIAIKQANTIHEINKQVRLDKNNLTKMDFKATKTLGIIIGVFLCCWTPFFICNIIDPIIGHSIPALLYEILMWVAYLNSMFNPIIYAFFHTWFRKRFQILLKKCFK